MKNRALAVGVVLAFLFSLSLVAAGEPIDWSSADCSSLLYEGTPLSLAQITLPPQIASFLDGERVNLHVSLLSGATKTVSGSIQDGFLSGISCTAKTDATLDAYTDEYVLGEIALSPEPLRAFQEAKSQGKIRFESHSFLTGIKMFLVDLFLMFQ